MRILEGITSENKAVLKIISNLKKDRDVRERELKKIVSQKEKEINALTDKIENQRKIVEKEQILFGTEINVPCKLSYKICNNLEDAKGDPHWKSSDYRYSPAEEVITITKIDVIFKIKDFDSKKLYTRENITVRFQLAAATPCSYLTTDCMIERIIGYDGAPEFSVPSADLLSIVCADKQAYDFWKKICREFKS